MWGLHCVVTGEVTRFKHAVISAARAARSYEFAADKDKIVVTAGVPFNTAGSTNIIRVASVDEKIINKELEVFSAFITKEEETKHLNMLKRIKEPLWQR